VKSILITIVLIMMVQLAAAQNDSAMALSTTMAKKMHGDSINFLLIGERLENQSHDGDNDLIWEAQGWIGGDINKLWMKTEGKYDINRRDTNEFELQALWSHAVSPFWDLQAGWRHDAEVDDGFDYLTFGFLGLAPYWFELDVAAFVSEKGALSARLEAEYELRITQRLILQPRAELNFGFESDREAGVSSGLQNTHLGLRLRYEIRREFAPYLGIAWKKSFSENASTLTARAGEASEASIVAGLRFWY
jgi:copper resistance protein B